MTISGAKNKLITLARSQIGLHETGNNRIKYSDDPNIIKLYGWYPQNQPWCDIFVDWLFLTAFGYENGSAMTYQGDAASAACANSMEFFRHKGAVTSIPEVGDVVFFYVSGGVNHMGIVEAVTDTMIKTIEGNSSDKVSERTYLLHDRTIAGYGRPNWNLVVDDTIDETVDETSDKPAETSDKPEYAYHNVQFGDGMQGTPEEIECGRKIVEPVQCLLNIHLSLSLEKDGEFGGETKKAVIEFQRRRGLEPSGEVDELTWKELILFEV